MLYSLLPLGISFCYLYFVFLHLLIFFYFFILFFSHYHSKSDTGGGPFANAVLGMLVSTFTERKNKCLEVRELFNFYCLCFTSSPTETSTNNRVWFWTITGLHVQRNLYNSVALSPKASYTDWATATYHRNLVPTFVDRGVSRGQRGGSPTVVNPSFLDRKNSGNSFWNCCTGFSTASVV
jgi:hypothetical protein